MKEAGYAFSIGRPDEDESFPPDMPVQKIPSYLARKKASSFQGKIQNEIVLAADTVVILGDLIMNKPADRSEAVDMLGRLSGNTHRVITAVCLYGNDKTDTFEDHTLVTFRSLTSEEIAYYVDHHKPYDKAGAYGAQDWIGMTAIERIEGSYFTVMGLPMHLVYEHLRSF